MHKYFLQFDQNFKLKARFNSVYHGERHLYIDDPEWVIPLINGAPDLNAIAPKIEVPNPACKIPDDAIEVDADLFSRTINENDGIWALVNEEVVKLPPVELSAEELLYRSFEIIRYKLQAEIDTKAKALGFSSGNALMLYAGFENPFKTLAQTFAQWEASVWVEAGAYKSEVVAGNQPMLTDDQAVALMPILIIES
jgi:hypothetical protein